MIKSLSKKINSWNWIKFRSIMGKTANIGGVISLGILLFSLIPMSHKINNIQTQLNQQDAEETLVSYFSYIEQKEFEKAFNLFSEDKKHNNTYTGFVTWLDNFVAFEGLKITPVIDKDSPTQKVFLVEFGFKKRGMLTIDEKRGFYLRYNGDKREINYSNVLYENGRKEGACTFYKFNHCK